MCEQGCGLGERSASWKIVCAVPVTLSPEKVGPRARADRDYGSNRLPDRQKLRAAYSSCTTHAAAAPSE